MTTILWIALVILSASLAVSLAVALFIGLGSRASWK